MNKTYKYIYICIDQLLVTRCTKVSAVPVVYIQCNERSSMVLTIYWDMLPLLHILLCTAF